ncbi:MAG: metallophosphoesterase [Planctomycetota bacterium]|nr:metallophosphoesterase [Planctomycetota bacterium]
MDNRPPRRCLPLLVLLLAAAGAARAQEQAYEWKDVARVVAVGDVHGDYEQFVKCLTAAGVIDEANKWIGGKTHLVQTGDILDRGPDSKKALDLLMDLEGQASAAGGCVHALVGNHEAMILAGDYRYLHEGEAEAYGGMDAFAETMGPRGKYGKWLRGSPAIIRINDVLFVHGGLSAAYGALPLAEINARVSRSLGAPSASGAAGELDGPLWYRGLADADEDALKGMLAPILRKHGVRHIVIGHTVSRSGQGISATADRALVMIDVGMSRTYRQGPAMCLLIEDGKFYTVSGHEKKELTGK